MDGLLCLRDLKLGIGETDERAKDGSELNRQTKKCEM